MDQQQQAQSEPLPIWFFVGLILAIYGVVILVGGLLGGSRPTTVFGEHRPELWWAGLMLVAGLAFLVIGLRRPRS